jgi:hypothetical protein
VPSYRIVRVSDELHFATLWIQAPHPLAQRIGYEFVSMMRDGSRRSDDGHGWASCTDAQPWGRKRLTDRWLRRNAMKWMKVSMSADDVQAGRPMQLQESFEAAFLAAKGPKEAAMFKDRPSRHEFVY